MVAAAVAVAALCLFRAAGPAHAADLPDRGWLPLTIGLLPVHAYLRSGAQLFAAPTPDALPQQWSAELVGHLSRLDQIRVVRSGDILARVRAARGYASRHKLGRTYQKLGMESFEAVQQTRALELLDQGLEAFLDVHADTTDPKRLADVQFYRALALLEAGNADAAHVAFRAMFLSDPGRTFRPGYYGKSVEAGLRRALTDLASQPDLGRLRYPVERLVELGRRARVSLLLLASVGGTTAAPILNLTLFDVRSRGIVMSERVALGADGSRQGPSDRVGRLLTAWHTCHAEARVASRFARPPRRLGVYLEVGYAHTLMLKYDSRGLIHSPGAYIGLTWEPSENLLVFGRIIQMVSLPDSNGDLLDSFVTSRLAAGVGLTGGSRDIRGYLEAGIELGLAFSDIELTRDPDCKHFGVDHERCSSVSTFTAPSVWAGFVLGAGMRWRLIKTWYLRAAVDLSLYVADTALVRKLNFPLSLSLGIGNRF